MTKAWNDIVEEVTEPLTIMKRPPFTYHSLRQIIREWFDFGYTPEIAAARLKQSVAWVENVLEIGKKPNDRINHSFKQVKCPECAGPILTGEAVFRKGDDYPKTSHGSCVHCRTIVMFTTFPDGNVLTTERLPIRKLDIPRSGCPQVHTTTDFYIQDRPGIGVVIRVGIQIMGSVNFKEMIGACPFDPNYHDNCIEGRGATEAEAMAMIKKEAESISRSIVGE